MTQYSNEAIASGLLDAAGWLENDGWISKHIRTIRLAAERLREGGQTNLTTITTDELAEMDALSAAATPGIWGVYEQAIRDQRDPIRELTDLVWATKPLGENLYMLEAGGKCPATTGCSAFSGANAKFIAALVNGYRSGHLRPFAQGIEARSDGTQSGPAEGESPVGSADAPDQSPHRTQDQNRGGEE